MDVIFCMVQVRLDFFSSGSVGIIEYQQGPRIACLKEIILNQNFLAINAMVEREITGESEYDQRLLNIIGVSL